MFRTVISSSTGASFNNLYSAIGTLVPVRLAAVRMQAINPSYTHAAVRRTGTNIPIRHTVYEMMLLIMDW